MALTSTRWRGIARLQSASENTPPMRFGEPDHNAAVVLQEVLIENGFSLPSGPDGIYGWQTAAAVQAAEVQFGLDTDQGVAGRQVLGALDSANAPPTFGAALARLDAPFALLKVQAALDALNAIPTPIIQADGTRVTIAQTTDDALRIHFRLINNGATPTIGILRFLTDADLATMLGTYNGIVRTLRNADTIFRDGVPTLGIQFPAESFLGGPSTYGPRFRSVTLPDGALIGPNSRAAVLIHESTHVNDGQSGPPAEISEFDPAYDVQDADLAIHNPSSYAGFAANIFPPPGEPNPRFGLGPGRAL